MAAHGDVEREARAAKACCGSCAHFRNDPAFLEATFNGLTCFSSGFASVRAHDGVCERHGVYLSCRETCRDFRARPGQ